MSASLVRSEPRGRALSAVAIAAGVGALLLRIMVIGAPGATVVFAAVLAALAVVSLAMPVGAGTAAWLPQWIVLALGAAAVIAIAIVVDARVPLPHGGLVLVLGVAAAASEELFFRRLVYGTLDAWHPAVAIIGSALLFAVVHVPLYGAPVFWVDLGAGLLFSWQRWASGNWTTPAATHALANVLAVLR
jgi:membrane protease YdiL (CAAX protease family)